MKMSEWRVNMSLIRPTRKGISGLVSYRAVVMCVAALSIFLARSAPPSFPRISPPSFRLTSLSLAFGSHSTSDHRRCFDREDPQGVTSASTSPSTPPPVFFPPPAPTSDPLLEFVTDGLHYNRPPPVS
jgi:hypothetical protein